MYYPSSYLEPAHPLLKSNLPVCEKHFQELLSSKISEQVALDRKYECISEDGARDLNFTGELARSGMSYVIRGVDGGVRGYGLKPDVPWTDDQGNIIAKYLMPTKKFQPQLLDIAKSMGKKIHDPNIVRWITEGAKKVDALASLGIPAIGINGVWGWIGENPYGGKGTPLWGWRDIVIRDAVFVIGFDADRETNNNVYQATYELQEFLYRKGARDVQISDFFKDGAV